MCADLAEGGGVTLAIVAPDDLRGGFAILRDGVAIVSDATPPPDAVVARGEDGCGRAGALVAWTDPAVPFGFHRYEVLRGGVAYGEVEVLAVGPGADQPAVGLLLGLALLAAGALLARVPASWGF